MIGRAQRLTVKPDEAAALDRLLGAYLATEEIDPGIPALERFRDRLRRGADMDHSAYDDYFAQPPEMHP